MKLFKQDGMILISILLLSILLVMLTVSMIAITANSLNMTGMSDKRTKALKAAEAGVEYAFYEINSFAGWGTSSGDIEDTTLGDGQKYTIIFDTSKTPHSKNNLMNKNPDGTTPGYAAEIISKGTYDNYHVYLRAIFVREDKFKYPVISGGPICIIGRNFGSSPAVSAFNFTGKLTDDPGRIHSNGQIDLKRIFCNGSSPELVDLNDGIMSASSGIVSNYDLSNVKTKKNVAPINIPETNVANIINSKITAPGCRTLTTSNGKFYLLGYFEHDVGDYYPHWSPFPHTTSGYLNADLDKDGGTLGSFTFGIAKFSETSYESFLEKYNYCYYNNLNDPASRKTINGKLNTYYPDVEFHDASELAFTEILNNEIGVTCVKTTEPDPAGGIDLNVITLSLTQDIYMPNDVILFMTENTKLGWPGYVPLGASGQFAQMAKTKGVFNLGTTASPHNIYANKKVCIGLPLSGTGNILAKDNIDFYLFKDVTSVILSDKSARATYGDFFYDRVTHPLGVSKFNFNGIIYGKDNVIISPSDGNSWYMKPIFNGSVICSDIEPNSMVPSPLNYVLGASSGIGWTAQYGMFIHSMLYNDTDYLTINHSQDGVDTLVSLKGYNFNVRKAFCEILK